MNTLLSFFLSKDGAVAVLTLILFGVVNHFSDPYNPWINFLARVGNLCIFIYILWRAVGKKIFCFFSQRKNAIVNELEYLTKQKLEAEKNLTEVKQHIALLYAEKEAIFEESRIQAEKLKIRILAEAQQQVEYIHEQARQAIETESKEILKNLRAHLADKIMHTVETELKNRLDTTMQLKLIGNSLKKVVLH